MHRILLILNTLKFLKLSQIFFLIKIRVLKTNLFYLNKSRFKKRLSEKKWVHDIPKNNSMLSKNTFIFLNNKKDIDFENKKGILLIFNNGLPGNRVAERREGIITNVFIDFFYLI